MEHLLRFFFKNVENIFIVKEPPENKRNERRMKMRSLQGDSTAGDKSVAPAGIAGKAIAELMPL